MRDNTHQNIYPPPISPRPLHDLSTTLPSPSPTLSPRAATCTHPIRPHQTLSVDRTSLSPGYHNISAKLKRQHRDSPDSVQHRASHTHIRTDRPSLRRRRRTKRDNRGPADVFRNLFGGRGLGSDGDLRRLSDSQYPFLAAHSPSMTCGGQVARNIHF